jgi:hypothetical protein
MGHEAFVYLKGDKNNVLARVLEEQMPKIGETYGLTVEPAKLHLFDPATEQRLN